jgi:glycosyltransferase involved in cell wall biosynthesis
MFSTLFCVEEMMVIQPFVSIIVNNYNYDRFLSDSIDSALAQTYQQTEVIVVDDGSVDNSQEIITSYGDRVVAVFKDNGGQASALNAGFAASKVSEVVKLFSSHPDIDWVFTESAPIKATDLVDTKLEDIFKDVLASGSKGLLRKIDFRANLRNAELPNFTPSTSNLCFSRKILEKIFPMPEVKGLSGIAICDTYLNLLAVGLDVGVVTTQNLGIFRLHQNNRFTTQEDNKKRELFSEILLATAYWMRIKFPEFGKLSKKLFSKGLANYFGSKNSDEIFEKMIKEYLSGISLLDKLEVGLMTLYYLLKLLSLKVI